MNSRTDKDLRKHKEEQKRARERKEEKARNKKRKAGEYIDKSRDNQKRKRKGGRPLADKPLIVQNISEATYLAD